MKHGWISYIPSPNSSLMISLMLSPKCITASFNLWAIYSSILSKNTIIVPDKGTDKMNQRNNSSSATEAPDKATWYLYQAADKTLEIPKQGLGTGVSR